MQITAAWSSDAQAEAERAVAWLRLPAIALLALGEGLAHPNPETTPFIVALVCYSAFSAAMLACVYLRPVSARLAIAATAVDIAAISVLAVLSGGAFSHARLAFFLIPVAVAFRFRASVTAAAAVATTVAYVVEAVSHPALRQPQAVRFIATQAGFLAWVGVACVLLSLLLGRRTELVSRLAEQRTQLLADALAAEQRERRALAEALHENALQNLLSARHGLQEVAEDTAHPALERIEGALVDTVGDLRQAVFELHPYVLEEAGLEAALRTVAQHAADDAGLALELDLEYPRRHAEEPLLFSAARELITNVVRHAAATTLAVRLADGGGTVELGVADDGRGFSIDDLADRLAEGHVGLASQRVRVEAAGGSMNIGSAPGEGTRISIRLPAPEARRPAPERAPAVRRTADVEGARG